MKKTAILIFTLFTTVLTYAQEIQTVFNSQRVTVYAALTNKFTAIRGDFANMLGAYGGVYITRIVMLGLRGFATKHHNSKTTEFRSCQDTLYRYGYVQSGMITDWVSGSNKPVRMVL